MPGAHSGTERAAHHPSRPVAPAWRAPALGAGWRIALSDVRARVRIREDAPVGARYSRHRGATVRAAGECETLIDTHCDPDATRGWLEEMP